MTIVAEVDAARSALADLDQLNSLEAKLKEIDIEVATSADGAVASFDVEGEQMRLSPHALKELAVTLNIPTNFLPRCSAELQSAILTHFQQELSDRKKVRVITGDSAVQGVVSPKFIPLLNTPLYDILTKAIGRGDMDKCLVVSMHHGWPATRFVIVNEDDLYDVSNEHYAPDDDGAPAGDQVRIGVDFINSLTATTHTEIRPAIYRLSSDTIAVTPVPKTGAQHYRYDRKANIEPAEWIPAVIDDIHEQHAQINEHLEAIASHDLGDVPLAIEGQLENLPGTMREAVHPAYEKEPTPTIWGLVNAITRAAKEADDEVPEGHRYQAQKFAGELALNAICEECKRPVIEHN